MPLGKQLAEFCYIQQKSAWSYMFETRFKEAGALFTAGRTDPRLLLRLFPDIIGDLAADLQDEEVEIFKGLQPMLGVKVLHAQTIESISKHLRKPFILLSSRGNPKKAI